MLSTFSVIMSVLYAESKREAERANHTLTFLQDTLFEASSHRLGVNATMLDLLGVASVRLEGEFIEQPDVAAALHYTLGHAYDTIWKRGDSIRHLRRALDLYTQAHGREHPDSVRVMVLLGMVLAQVRDDQSVTLQREALEIRTNQLGEDHFLVAQSKAELAYALSRAAIPRQWSESERLYQEAEPRYREQYPKPHQDFARFLHTAATMYHVLGRYDEAEPLYHESLTISNALLGLDHQFVMECMMDYSVVLSELERYDEALALMKQVIDHAPNRLGRSALSEMQLRTAQIYLAMGDEKLAGQCLDRAYVSQCRLLAVNHSAEGDRFNNLADLIESTSGAVEMETYLQTFELIETTETSQWDATENYLELGLLWMSEGSRANLELALSLLEKSCSILTGDGEGTKLALSYVKTIYGECLTRLEQYSKAESQLLSAHEFLLSRLGSIHPSVRSAKEKLHQLYIAWGKPIIAKNYHTPERS